MPRLHKYMPKHIILPTDMLGKQPWGDPPCNFNGKYLMHIQNNERWGEDPMELPLSPKFFDRREFRPGWMTNTSYHISFVDSPPMEKISFIPEQFEQHDWVRISYCLHGAEFRYVLIGSFKSLIQIG